MILNKSFFENQKVSMFSERADTNQVIEYAKELAGVEGVTVAMMMYNTVMQQLADATGDRNYVDHDHACELAFTYGTMKEKKGEGNENGEKVWKDMLSDDEEKYGFRITNPETI